MEWQGKRGWCPVALAVAVMELSPCARFKTYMLCSPAQCPNQLPEHGQAFPGSASSPPLFSASLEAAWQEFCVRALCKSARNKPETSGTAGRVTGGTCANESGCPMVLPLDFKRRCQRAVQQGAGQLVSASERCKIAFPTCSCLEKRQEAAMLVHPVQLLDEWEGKPEAFQKVCGSWYGQEPGFKPQNYPSPGLEAATI